MTASTPRKEVKDAAPKLTGIRDPDRANEERLLEAIEALLPQLLREGGSLLLKILEGPEAQAIDKHALQSRTSPEIWPSGSRDAVGDYFRLLSGGK